MPYSITTKDGITINNIPDDVPPDSPELKERVARIRAGDTSKPQTEAPRGPSAIPGARDAQGRSAYDVAQQQQAAQPVTLSEQMFGLGSPIASLFKGAVVNPLVGVNQLLANTGLFGSKVKEGANAAAANLQQNSAEARERVGRGGFDFVELAGSVFSPVNKLAPVKGPTLTQTVGRSGAVGAAQAAIAPTSDTENYLKEKANDAVIGAVLGGALPIIGAGLKGAKKLGQQLLEPMTQTGRENMIRAWFNGLLPKDQAKVREALSNAPELVPGSRPTAAQALAEMPESTALAAAEKQVSKMPESRISQDFAVRRAEQEAARKGMLGTVAKTPEELAAAVDARAAAAAKNYKEAFEKTIQATPKLAASFRDNPYLKAASDVANDKASAFKDNTGKTPSLTQFLHWTKQSLDDRISSADTDPSLKKTLVDTKNNLVKWMVDKNPEYNKAREAFKEASIPINQMQIGQQLMDLLQSPQEIERAAMFAKGIADAPKTIKKATGETVYKSLEDALTPKQVAAVRSVEADLLRNFKASQNAKGTNVQKPQVDKVELPPLLNRTWTIIKSISEKAAQGVNEKLNREIADLLLDPPALATFLSQMPKEPGKSKVFASALMQKLSPENQQKLARAIQRGYEEVDTAQMGALSAPTTEKFIGASTNIYNQNTR